MNYTNLRLSLLGCVSCLALFSSTLFIGCGTENDFSALECFNVDCSDRNYTDDDYRSSSSNARSSSSIDEYNYGEPTYDIPSDCESYTSDILSVNCTANEVGTVIYDVYHQSIYACERMEGLTYTRWVEKPDLKNCSDYEPSSYSSSESSSSSAERPQDIPDTCGDLWCLENPQEVVETGFDDGTLTYGIWKAFDDQNEGGSSYISPPFEDCDGLCGTVSLGEPVATKAYAGYYFDIGGKKQVGYDISEWEGICITYMVTNDAPMIELVPENENTTTLGYDNYVFQLDPYTNIANIPWSSFTQEGEGKLYPIDLTTFIQQVASIKISWKSTSVTDTDFIISSIGKYNSCQ